MNAAVSSCFGVDVGDVALNRTDAQDQFAGYFLLGPPARHQHEPVVRPAAAIIAIGLALYLVCLWLFASVGRGTPGPWDAPRRFVAVGPYRWVRNPIYLAALLVVIGEARLFGSLSLLVYAVAIAVGCHLFVVAYEEPTMHRRFGDEYDQYRLRVSRWLPRPPAHVA